MPFKPSPRHYDEQALYEYAVGALGRRMRTVAELKRLMRTRVREQANRELLVEVVVARLKEQRYLNDAGYAATYSSFRKENEKFGSLRVVRDLKAKGMHADVVERAVKAAYEGVNEEDLARAFLARKRIAAPSDQKQAARIFRALARAGFSSRVIFPILKKWKVEDETLSALEQEQQERQEREEQEETES